MTALLVALGGGTGAVARYAAVALGARFGRSQRAATLAVNVSGCAIAGAAAGFGLTPPVRALVVAGFLGAYTTFSAFAVQTVQGPARDAAAGIAASVVLSIGAAVAGLAAAGVLGA